MASWKQTLTERLLEMKQKYKDNHFTILTRKEYDNLINDIEIAKNTPQKTTIQYRRLNRFQILEVAGVKRLIKKSDTDDIRYFLSVDEIFDVIDSAHKAIGHGGRDRLKAETAKKYANISLEMINLFLSMCEACQLKRKKTRKGLVSKPILHSQLNSRCQVDLIDMQTQADKDFKFIMVYQDHFTKFVMLRPLKTKRAEEVAYNIFDIFTIFGAPCILHSDNGREFVNKIISELKQFWPGLKLVNGKPRHSQSQGSVERANQDVENMLATWMKDNDTLKWAEGLRLIQFMKNRAMHAGLRQSPYKAMFGIEPRVGLTSSSLPTDVIDRIQTEEDLQNVITQEDALEDNTDSENMLEAEEVQNEVDIVNPNSEIDINLDQEQNLLELVQCYVCDTIISTNAQTSTCRTCQRQVHFHCRGASSSSVSDVNFECTYCNKETEFQKIRNNASENLIKQAAKMRHITSKIHPKANVGDNVTVPIPDVDKAKGALRNVLAVVTEVTEDGLYKLGTKEGTLSNFYSRGEFDICQESFISFDSIPNKKVCLRSVASASNLSAQGYVRCTCKKNCSNNLCKCKKRKILCNSKCHSSQPCKNK